MASIVRTAAAAALAITFTVPAAAEDAAVLGPGVRVRVSVAATRERLKGTVQSLDQAVLAVISDDRQLVKIPRANITRLETGWGRKGNARKGLIIGGLVGLGSGLAACAVADGSHSDFDDFDDFEDFYDDDCDGGEWVGIPLLAGATWGGIGALIGHFIKSDRWVEMPIDKVHVAIGPSDRGLGPRRFRCDSDPTVGPRCGVSRLGRTARPIAYPGRRSMRQLTTHRGCTRRRLHRRRPGLHAPPPDPTA